MLTNVATAGFDLAPYRWMLLAGLGVLNAGYIAFEILMSRREGTVDDADDIGSLAPPHLPVAQVVEAVRALPLRSVSRPWMQPSFDREVVDRPAITAELRRLLLDGRGGTVGVTTALFGAGGFGKTTAAAIACTQPEVAAAFTGGLLWVTVGEDVTPTQLAEKINDLCAQLGAERPNLSDPEQAGYRLGQVLEGCEPVLLVVDDIWTAAALRPFLSGGSRCTRLVTTRRATLLPQYARLVKVDQMAHREARELLDHGLTDLPGGIREALLELTGRWPLLLALVNGALLRAARDGLEIAVVARTIAERLAGDGPTTLDVRTESRRERAVRLCVRASLDLLSVDERRRYLELGVFADDVDIPRDVIELLWGQSGGLSPYETSRLCADLAELSLVQSYRGDTGALRLHDVLRAFVRGELGWADITQLNRGLLSAAAALLLDDRSDPPLWWLIPADADYYWRYLSYHLVEGDRPDELRRVVCDLRWVVPRIVRYGAAAAETDVRRATGSEPAALSSVLARDGHLFGVIEPAEALVDIVVSRLQGVRELADVAMTARGQRRLRNRWPLPDADPALLRVLTGHRGWTTACDISGDGRRLATVGRDGTARIWRLSDGAAQAVLDGTAGALATCAFLHDGTRLITGGEDATVRVWDLDRGTIAQVLTGHTKAITSCAVAPDGSWFVTTSEDGTARAWNADGMAPLWVLSAHTAKINSCSIAGDGEWLATAGEDGTVRTWSAQGDERQVLRGSGAPVTSCVIGRTGDWLAATSEDGTTRIWTGDGREMAVIEDPDLGMMHSASFAQRNWLATTGWNGLTSIRDIDSGDMVSVLKGHVRPATYCAVAPDDSKLATTSWDGTIRIWDTSKPVSPRAIDLYSSQAARCRLFPDESRLVGGYYDGTVRLWDVATATVALTLAGHTAKITGIAVAPGGNWLVTTAEDKTGRIWSTSTGECVAVLDHPEAVMDCAISPDGGWAGTLTRDGRVRFWEPDGRLRHIVDSGLAGSTRCVVEPVGASLAVGGQSGSIAIVDIADGRTRSSLSGHTDAITGLTLTLDGRLLASSSVDGSTKIWDTATGALAWDLHGHPGPHADCAYSPDGRWLATAGNDLLRVWNTAKRDCHAAMRVDGDLHGVAWRGDNLVIAGERGVYLFAFTP
ncbi:NB-ARC domain-containing protein [Phytohabitans flavus]|uniref:NB-ARC domain-containing protein n=1 Tax=Phytohabitans flavus TaxID=1076124 RepID=UPI0031F11D73